MEFERNIVSILAERVQEKTSPIQVVVGPRQTGKTTAVHQMLNHIDMPYHSVSADNQVSLTQVWLEAEWQKARDLITKPSARALLVVDEIQNVHQWSSIVKKLRDEDIARGVNLKIVLSGSSSLLLQKGLKESLMGRYEIVRCHHWNYGECQRAFGYTLDDFLIFGGFPGSAQFRSDIDRWRKYMVNSIIEPTISQDVLSMEQVRKPALLNSLFKMGAMYSGQEVSYRKLLGQLDDAGNTVTIAGYLDLLSDAGMLSGLQKYSESLAATRKSSPRLMVHDTSLMTAFTTGEPNAIMGKRDYRGHLMESAVGSHLLAQSIERGFDLFWWRDGNREVDFVAKKGEDIVAVEVKSGRVKNVDGMKAFLSRYPQSRSILIGEGGTSFEDFLSGRVTLFPNASVSIIEKKQPIQVTEKTEGILRKMTGIRGFWSYAHKDDAAENGLIVELSKSIQKEYEFITGNNLTIFVDKDDIAWGEKWRERIDTGLDTATFFIPIITPTYLSRLECRKELIRFTQNAEKNGTQELVMPIIYAAIPGFDDENSDDELVSLIKEYQYIDWRPYRFEEPTSRKYAQGVNKLAQRLNELNEKLNEKPLPAPHTLSSINGYDESTTDSDSLDIGFYDKICALEEESPKLVSLISQIGEDVETIGGVAKTNTDRITKASEKGSDLSVIMAIFGQMAHELAPPADRMKQNSALFLEKTQQLDIGMLPSIKAAKRLSASSDQENGFLSSLVSLNASAQESSIGVQGMMDSVMNIEGMSRALNRPLATIKEGLSTYLEACSIIIEWGAEAAAPRSMPAD